MRTIFKIAGTGSRHWICSAGCFDGTYYTQEQASEILKGTPERCLVNVYDTVPYYRLVCRVILWRVGTKGVLADEVWIDDFWDLLHGEISTNAPVGSLMEKSPLKKMLSAYAPDWKKQISSAVGASTWTVQIRTEGHRVFAFSNRRKIPIMPSV